MAARRKASRTKRAARPSKAKPGKRTKRTTRPARTKRASATPASRKTAGARKAGTRQKAARKPAPARPSPKKAQKKPSKKTTQRDARGRTVTRAAPAPAKPKPAPTPSPRLAAANTERIGAVVHFFPRASAAAIALDTGSLRLGDLLHFRGHTTDFLQHVERLEREHAPVEGAGPGEVVAVQVTERVRAGDDVLRVRPAEGDTRA